MKVDGGIFIKLRFGSVVTYSSNNEPINIFVHDPCPVDYSKETKQGNTHRFRDHLV